MTEKFVAAVAKTIRNEGGYVNAPHDPGGETKCGISKRTYPGLEISTLTELQAREIYYRDWWLAYGYERMEDAALAAKVFDLAVNMGPVRAHTLLQQAANTILPGALRLDGKLGPLTMQAVNNMAGTSYGRLLLETLKLRAIEYYLGLEKDRYLRGWIRRALS